VTADVVEEEEGAVNSVTEMDSSTLENTHSSIANTSQTDPWMVIPKTQSGIDADALEAEITSSSIDSNGDSTGGKFDLPIDIAEEKRTILREGFITWTKNDYKCFVNAMEKYGRYDKANVFTTVANEIDKPESEIRRYYKVFWEKYQTTLADWTKVIDRIEKGERKIQRNNEIVHALKTKLSRHTNIEYADMPVVESYFTISYGASGNKDRHYTEDNDRFLLVTMDKYGYSNIERIMNEIKISYQYRFDWFFKSRSYTEIQRRCEYLIRLVEKENEEIEKLEMKKNTKASKVQVVVDSSISNGKTPSKGGAVSSPKPTPNDKKRKSTSESAIKGSNVKKVKQTPSSTKKKSNGNKEVVLDDGNDYDGGF
jgi:hypothetical protein